MATYDAHLYDEIEADDWADRLAGDPPDLEEDDRDELRVEPTYCPDCRHAGWHADGCPGDAAFFGGGFLDGDAAFFGGGFLDEVP